MVFLNNLPSYNSSSAWPTSYTASNSGTPALSQTPPLVNGNSATVTTSGTLRAKLRWVYRDGDATLAPNPPPQVIIRETASASWSYTGNISNVTGSGSADNGKGGQYQTFSGTKGGYSFGAWSTQINSSSGIVERSITISANASVQVVSPPTLPNASLQAGGYYTVQLDNRAVSISSTLGMTYYRNGTTTPPTRVPHYVSPEGYIYTHSAKANAFDTYPTLTYHASPVGSWSTNPPTYYHWYSSVKDYAAWGYMSSLSIPDLVNTYTPGNNYSAPERIHIHLIDGADQVNAEGYYFVTFHDKYEDWVRTSTVSHPAVFNPAEGALNPDWTLFQNFVNSAPTPLSTTVQLSQTMQLTETGSIELQANLQLTDPVAVATFQAKESITIAKMYTLSIATTLNVTTPPMYRTKIYLAAAWEDRAGKCSLWELNGYTRDVNWTGKKIYNQTISYLVDTQAIRP